VHFLSDCRCIVIALFAMYNADDSSPLCDLQFKFIFVALAVYYWKQNPAFKAKLKEIPFLKIVFLSQTNSKLKLRIMTDTCQSDRLRAKLRNARLVKLIFAKIRKYIFIILAVVVGFHMGYIF